MVIALLVFAITFILGVSLLGIVVCEFNRWMLRPHSDAYYRYMEAQNEIFRNLIRR